jgi:cysteine desulfurase
MWANNETGTMFPMDRIREIIKTKGVLFHSDAVQVIGKLPVRLRDGGIHFASLSGHKLHCPKGVGVLYVNRRSRFLGYITGGGQESGRRAGTENVASIVGLGKACELASQNIEREAVDVRAMRDKFEQAVVARISGVIINGDTQSRLPNTSNLAFEGVDSEALLMMLDDAGICCSAGSACTTGSLYPSHVLKAMGLTDAHARSSLRFSLGRFNSDHEIERTIAVLENSVEKLRPLAAT